MAHERLKACIGKGVAVTVHIADVTWNYGDSETSVYDVQYRMLLKNVTDNAIEGELLEPVGDKKEGEWISQKLHIYIPDSGAWQGPVSKDVTRVECDDAIVFELG